MFAFSSAKDCVFCQYPLVDDENDRVRHHCHLTGKFIGAAHNACNLRGKKLEFIPAQFRLAVIAVTSAFSLAFGRIYR
ncbi:hypothetical protein ACUWC1_30305, partial [Klebsiella pneumoniae]